MSKGAKKKRSKTLYVNSSTAKTLTEYLLNKGIDPALLESTLKFKLQDLETSDFRLSISVYNDLWHLALEFSDDPSLGLKLAQNPYNEEMGLVAHIFFNSPTFSAGLKQYQRYYSLVNEGMHIEIETDDEAAYVKYICDEADVYCPADMEHTLAISVLRVKQNISASISLLAVHFEHSAPEDITLYEKIFPCSIEFDRPHCALIFKKDYLNYKLPKRSAYLYKILTHHIEALLKKVRPESTFAIKVKSLVERQLAKDCIDAEHIAEKLYMSRHTLYRKLKLEQVSFHDLVDQVREEKAYALLDQKKHSLSEVAFLLGFSELSAFSRAFKRWTGQSPAKYIKSQNSK